MKPQSAEVLLSAMPPSVLALHSSDAEHQSRAWAEVYDWYFDSTYRLILRCGVADADAEDLAQRVFVTAFRRLSERAEVGNLGAWLRGITLKKVAEHFRWHRVRQMKAWLLDSTPGAAPPLSSSPEVETEGRRLQQQIQMVLGSMSAKLRDVLVLTEVEGLRPQEAADVLGCPVNTVRSRRRLAVEEFRRQWRARVPEESHGD